MRTGRRRGITRMAGLGLVLGLLAAAAVQAAPDGDEAPVPFLGGFLKETRIVYPLRIGAWEAVGERLYDEAELGASVRYQSGDSTDRWIDVYFYPAGVVPDSHLHHAAQAALQGIESTVGQSGGYVEGDFGGLRRFQVMPPGDAPAAIPARSADMRLVREDGEYHSALTLLIDRLYYVKGRYTAAAGAVDRREARDVLEAFITELVRGTYIGSTGRCWSPAPVDPLPAGAPAPAESRLSIVSDDAAGAWLVGGRVLAHDPLGDAAQALAMLAMAVDGRLYPGCVGAEPHNPDVSDGLREIRLEYRAPADVRGDGGRRLWPSRSGVG